MTREHLWSDWMSSLLPIFVNEWFEFSNILRGKTRDVSNSYFRTLQGTPKNKTIKVVCKKCNTGWMSTLETSAQPWLKPLIKGEPVALGVMERIKITEWIFMKFLVTENTSFRTQAANPIFNKAVREEFMTRRTIPAGIRVLIALQNGVKWATGFHLHGTGLAFSNSLPPPPRDPALPTKTVQVLTWGIGRLLIYLVASTDPVVFQRLILQEAGPLISLWPISGSSAIVWPTHNIPVGDAYIDSLADAFQQFISSDEVRFFDNPP